MVGIPLVMVEAVAVVLDVKDMMVLIVRHQLQQELGQLVLAVRVVMVFYLQLGILLLLSTVVMDITMLLVAAVVLINLTWLVVMVASVEAEVEV